MKRWIHANSYSNSSYSVSYYRAVPEGADPLDFKPYELGIHCGSLSQAKHINDMKYRGGGDIYKIAVTNFNASEAVSDFEVWNSVEAVFEILRKGFGIDVSKQDIIADYRSGRFQKDNAAEYMSDYVGSDNLIVAYNNVEELPEEDIIILNDSCIKSVKKVED